MSINYPEIKSVHHRLDEKLRGASNKDKSRIQRAILTQNSDLCMLNKNYSERLYELLILNYKIKTYSFEDKTIESFIKNRIRTELKMTRKFKTKIF